MIVQELHDLGKNGMIVQELHDIGKNGMILARFGTFKWYLTVLPSRFQVGQDGKC